MYSVADPVMHLNKFTTFFLLQISVTMLQKKCNKQMKELVLTVKINNTIYNNILTKNGDQRHYRYKNYTDMLNK